jgi:hypothetical protein
MVKITLALALGIVALLGCKPDGVVTRDDAAVAPTPKAAPPPPHVDTISEQVAKLPSVGSALSAASPKMADSFNSIDDDGTILLARWSAKNLRWADVAVAKNEVSFAAVMKDPEEARTKRMCASGSIIQIAVAKTQDGKLFDGLFQDYSGNLYDFFAAGGSGDLVSHSPMRFCGFVTGKYDYSNSGGGTGHAIKLVGMFDLPENKKP